METLSRDLMLFRPELALVLGLLLVVLADTFLGRSRDAATRFLTIAALAIAVGATLAL